MTIHMDPAHSQGLVLAPGQGCERCCNQTASSKLPAPFQVQNDRGDWLAATGSGYSAQYLLHIYDMYIDVYIQILHTNVAYILYGEGSSLER